jgi:deazaflavin-dependent oxidoreductase (nitroreductase family)
MTWRRYSEFRGRRLRPDEVLLERFAMSPLGYRFLRDVAPVIDKRVIPRTNGRLSSTGVDKVGILTAIGAKSGQRRTQPVVMVPDGAGLLVIGSNYGRPPHPAWAHNLLAHPECEVTFGGTSGPYVATLLSGEERAAAWGLAVDFYAGYAAYARTCAPREIRVFRLTPAG